MALVLVWTESSGVASFLWLTFATLERVAHLANVPLPGGAKAIREPWRLAAVYLQRTFGNDFSELDLPFNRQMDRESLVDSEQHDRGRSELSRDVEHGTPLRCSLGPVNLAKFG